MYVSLDGGHTWAVATGTASWSFGLPTGAATWPLGSAHEIWVYASDGPHQSAITKLSVRAGPNKDANGDGYADLVVGAPGGGSSQSSGAVSIYHSRGPSGIDSAATPDTILAGSTDFGSDALLVDVNADGYADVLVADSTAGVVYVFHSSGAAGVMSGMSNSAAITFAGSAGALFGFSLAAGDVNADGYPDIVIGDPSTSLGAGAVYVFQSAGAEVSGVSATNATVMFLGTAQASFGDAVALGDTNGDGQLDLLVGAGLQNNLDGASYVFLAGARGLIGQTSPAATLAGSGGRGFGKTVALGDLNGDGYADAVVGAFLQQGGVGGPGAGAAYVFQSNGDAGIASANDDAATALVTGPDQSELGAALAVADLNGDGYGDLAVGAPYMSNAVYVFEGSASGIQGADCSVGGVPCPGAAMTLAGPATAYASFGCSVALADVDGDGLGDVVVGADTVGGHGGVFVFVSTGDAGASSATSAAAQTTLSGNASSYFGHSVD